MFLYCFFLLIVSFFCAAPLISLAPSSEVTNILSHTKHPPHESIEDAAIKATIDAITFLPPVLKTRLADVLQKIPSLNEEHKITLIKNFELSYLTINNNDIVYAIMFNFGVGDFQYNTDFEKIDFLPYESLASGDPLNDAVFNMEVLKYAASSSASASNLDFFLKLVALKAYTLENDLYRPRMDKENDQQILSLELKQQNEIQQSPLIFLDIAKEFLSIDNQIILCRWFLTQSNTTQEEAGKLSRNLRDLIHKLKAYEMAHLAEHAKNSMYKEYDASMRKVLNEHFENESVSDDPHNDSDLSGKNLSEREKSFPKESFSDFWKDFLKDHIEASGILELSDLVQKNKSQNNISLEILIAQASSIGSLLLQDFRMPFYHWVIDDLWKNHHLQNASLFFSSLSDLVKKGAPKSWDDLSSLANCA